MQNRAVAPGSLYSRQFNRILEIAAPVPASSALRGFAEFFTNPTHRGHVEVEAARFADGNRRALDYIHYQVPLTDSLRQWTVVPALEGRWAAHSESREVSLDNFQLPPSNFQGNPNDQIQVNFTV